MRKSIFDIVSNNIDMRSEANRLIYMAEKDEIIHIDQNLNINLILFVEKFCFNNWKSRGHCVDLNDFLKALNYDYLKKCAAFQIDSFITLLELIYNFWHITKFTIGKSNKYYPIGNFYHLKRVMDDILQQYNQKAYVDETNQYCLIVEDKQEVTAVCEIVSPSLSLEIIKYNHRTLKGNIELKKQILVDLGAKIEPERKYLKTIDDKLEDDIFFALNNLNLRHNNIKQGDKNYHELVEKMSNEELEEWYDEVYQMILLALLLIDHKSRTEKIKQLKKDIAGENKNGQT